MRAARVTIGPREKDHLRLKEQHRLVQVFTSLAEDLGYKLPAHAAVLDFGCGDGDAVMAWRAAGYAAFGCDVVLERPGEWLYPIEEPYRLPFTDETFDLVVSNQVLEHVQDHHAAFAEIKRVLKPGALSVHLFPPRWAPIEVHTLVPLASVLPTRWWLASWARLGVRNEFQSGLSSREVTELNLDYLRTRTNYLSRQQLLSAANRWFDDVRFVEQLLLKYGRRTRRFYPLVKALPVLPRIYSGLRGRCFLLGTRREQQL